MQLTKCPKWVKAENVVRHVWRWRIEFLKAPFNTPRKRNHNQPFACLFLVRQKVSKSLHKTAWIIDEFSILCWWQNEVYSSMIHHKFTKDNPSAAIENRTLARNEWSAIAIACSTWTQSTLFPRSLSANCMASAFSWLWSALWALLR